MTTEGKKTTQPDNLAKALATLTYLTDNVETFDPPSIHVSEKGVKSVRLGRDFHQPGYWRTQAASIVRYYAQLMQLCEQLEKETS